MDLMVAGRAASDLLTALGLPIDSTEISETPRRMTHACAEMLRVVDFFSHRAQTQERLTEQVAEHLRDQLTPRGVGVVIEAEHTCMSLRGVRAAGTRTVTSALFGTLRENPSSRAEILSLTRRHKEA